MKICLLGASGSIGRQTIDVIEKHPNDFELVSFSVGKRTRCIGSILRKHPSVTHVFVIDKRKANYYSTKYPNILQFFSQASIISKEKKISESLKEFLLNIAPTLDLEIIPDEESIDKKSINGIKIDYDKKKKYFEKQVKMLTN